MIVLDASAAVDLVLRRPEQGPWVAERVFAGGSLHSTHLIDLEVASALRRFVATGTMSVDRARQGLDVFLRLAITRHAPRVLVERVWALRGSFTAYDASYVALAEALDAALVTTDARLARAGGHRATVSSFPG
ncbi:MAG: PIN domain-containing protein [Gaiellaceae bacterium MAG52_C11]|nr:PIN domain-containing protein [Candidatus Gaiellasilicea maunaloa]